MPLADIIVDQANGNLSNDDNIVTTLRGAAKLANMRSHLGWANFQSSSIIRVRAGTYIESAGFDNEVLIHGEAATNGRIPVILGPDDGQTLRLGKWVQRFLHKAP
jgi:hypothetical protein